MSRIFVKQDLKTNSSLSLQSDDHHYVTHVLRMKVGDPLFLFNGGNEEFCGQVQSIGKNETIIKISTSQKVDKESPLEIIIGQGIPKGQKLDDLIPKITELGVSGLTPLITERADVKTVSQNKFTRWQKIATQSAQQTGRTKVPTLNSPSTLKDFLKHYSDYEKILFYELEHSKSFKDILQNTLSTKFCLIIGPEGGFTPEEISLAIESGCKIASLGKRILRTETVAPAVTAILQYTKGDLNSV